MLLSAGLRKIFDSFWFVRQYQVVGRDWLVVETRL